MVGTIEALDGCKGSKRCDLHIANRIDLTLNLLTFLGERGAWNP